MPLFAEKTEIGVGELQRGATGYFDEDVCLSRGAQDDGCPRLWPVEIEYHKRKVIKENSIQWEESNCGGATRWFRAKIRW